MRCFSIAVAVLCALLLTQCVTHAETITVTCSTPGNSNSATFDGQDAIVPYCANLLGPNNEPCNSGMTSNILYGGNANYSSVLFQADKRDQAPIAMVLGRGPVSTTTALGTAATPLGRTQFWPRTDEFSMIDIKNSFLDVTPGDTEKFFVKFEYAGFSTPPARVAEFDTEKNRMLYVPYWTVVIKLDKGKVTGIRYDSNCSGCKYMCIDGACPVPKEECEQHKSGLDCSLKAYVAWEGTDKNGDYMLSVQRTIRNFRSFSASFAVDVASQIYDKVKRNLPDVPNNWTPNTPSIPWK